MADSEVAKKAENAKYVPTGKPRGRPPGKKVETRGRPPGAAAAGRVVKKDTPKKGRGRPAKKVTEGGKGKTKKEKAETEEEEDEVKSD